MCKEAEAMVSGGHYGADDITSRQDQLSAKWTQLKVMIPNLQYKQQQASLPHPTPSSSLSSLSPSSQKALSEARKAALEASLQAQQYYSDAQEAESWMKEKEPLVSSGDYGKDEDSAQVRTNVDTSDTCCAGIPSTLL